MSFEKQFDDIEAVIEGDAPPFFSRAGGKIFIIWLIFTAIGVLIGIFAPHHLLPTLQSGTGGDAWATIVFFTILAAPVAAFVYGVSAYSLIAWRHKGSGSSDEPPPDGPPQRGNSPMTVVWVGISAVLVIVLLVWGMTVWSAQQVAHLGALQVNVTGQQWLWTYEYPGSGVSTRTLELPLNRPVQFNVTAKDVIHGFYLDTFGVQTDANPNEITVIRTTPDKLGHFTVRCSQLCGLYHAFMYNKGAVVTPQQFGSWLVSQGATAEAAAKEAGVPVSSLTGAGTASSSTTTTTTTTTTATTGAGQ